jgi:hypothetical protein
MNLCSICPSSFPSFLSMILLIFFPSSEFYQFPYFYLYLTVNYIECSLKELQLSPGTCMVHFSVQVIIFHFISALLSVLYFTHESLVSNNNFIILLE